MKITTAIKKYNLETYGMSDKTLLDLIGFDTIADECAEDDTQYYIDQAYFEQQAILRECEEEFGRL